MMVMAASFRLKTAQPNRHQAIAVYGTSWPCIRRWVRGIGRIRLYLWTILLSQVVAVVAVMTQTTVAAGVRVVILLRQIINWRLAPHTRLP